MTLSPLAIQAGYFEEEVRKLERRSALSPVERPVLFYGSSSIRLWETLPAEFPEIPVLNHAFGGSELAECVRLFERLVTPYAPQSLVVYAGDNDLEHGWTPQAVTRSLETLIEKTRSQLGPIPLAYISIKPSPARAWLKANIFAANRLCQQLIERDDNQWFIDIEPDFLTPAGQPRPELFTADGLHMNERGYAIWREKLKTHLPRLHVI